MRGGDRGRPTHWYSPKSPASAFVDDTPGTNGSGNRGQRAQRSCCAPSGAAELLARRNAILRPRGPGAVASQAAREPRVPGNGWSETGKVDGSVAPAPVVASRPVNAFTAAPAPVVVTSWTAEEATPRLNKATCLQTALAAGPSRLRKMHGETCASNDTFCVIHSTRDCARLLLELDVRRRAGSLRVAAPNAAHGLTCSNDSPAAGLTISFVLPATQRK